MNSYSIRYIRQGKESEGIEIFFVFATTKDEAIRRFVKAGNNKKSIISISEC